MTNLNYCKPLGPEAKTTRPPRLPFLSSPPLSPTQCAVSDRSRPRNIGARSIPLSGLNKPATGVLSREQQPEVLERAREHVVRGGVVLPGGDNGDVSGAAAVDSRVHLGVFYGEKKAGPPGKEGESQGFRESGNQSQGQGQRGRSIDIEAVTPSPAITVFVAVKCVNQWSGFMRG